MPLICAGIDVAAKSLECNVLSDGDRAGRGRRLEASNDPAGHAQLIAKLKALKVDHAVCEATGVYHLDIALALHEAGIPVMVANPRQTKRFIEARLRNLQTDRVDAHELAQFGLRMDFVPWQPPSAASYALHRIARSLHGYVAQAAAAKNRLHAASMARQTPDAVHRALRAELELYERLCEELSQEALEILAADPALSHRFEILQTIPGVATKSAIQLLGEICVIPEGLSAKAWVKLAGLDPTTKQSGTSVATKPRISKRGNAHLRAALFMPAMGARRHDPAMSQFADRLIARGKAKLQAITAIQRKLLHGIHAMLRTGQPWKGDQLIADQG